MHTDLLNLRETNIKASLKKSHEFTNYYLADLADLGDFSHTESAKSARSARVKIKQNF